ncbi:MAG: hypothetical protein OQK82_00590 [Candidatus Pacearchaeota archaeon]|nr:hypothetical protein [Candidatus Pacearchaeota archaeon]
MLVKSLFKKKKEFKRIAKGIKEIKIQGATNIARAALKAYNLIPTKKSKKKLLKLRPTEPMLMNVLNKVDKESPENIINHFNEAQDKINKKVFKLIKNKDVIFTHCHSTNVVKALIYAKKKGKKFEVYNTETRPLYQGRKTARELSKAKIKVTMFVDSAVGVALSKEQGTKKVNKVFLGADAILKNGVVNKIGSETIARLAKQEKIPVYVIADSWKSYPKKIKLEERDFHEVWKKLSKKSKIKIVNPAFEFVPNKLIEKIITEE